MVATPFLAGTPGGRRRALVDLAIIAALLAAWLAAGSALRLGPESLSGRAVPFIRMAMLLIAATLLLRRNGETWASVGLRRPRSARRTAGLVIAGYLIAYALALPFAYVLIRVGHVPARGADLLVNRHGGIAEYLFWLVPAAWGLAAFGEEMLFRGFVFTRLMRLMPPGRLGLSVSLGLQSLVFGALHYAYGPGTALVAAVLGLVLGGVYLVGGRNLWAAILLHGLIDTTSISVAYFVGVKP